MAFKNEDEEQYNWLIDEDPETRDQHFGESVGVNPCQVFSGGFYETLEEGCYRRRPTANSDDL